jgi:REP element-mobilizing transposase RayT
MVLNRYGEIVREEWLKSSEIRSEIRLGEYVIMPNHLHAIVYIVDHRDDRGGDGPWDDRPWGDQPVAPTGLKPKSLGTFMAGFKSAVTKRSNAMRNTPGMSVWQRNYYEHVIRNETDYHRIAEYIADNPRCWQEDSLHPANHTVGKTSTINDTGFAGTPSDGTVGATDRSPAETTGSDRHGNDRSNSPRRNHRPRDPHGNDRSNGPRRNHRPRDPRRGDRPVAPTEHIEPGGVS